MPPHAPGSSSPSPSASGLGATALALAGPLLLALLVYGPVPARVGLLCDDHDLLAAAAEGPPWAGLEHHHWAPVQRLLARATGAGWLSPAGWHAALVLVHGLNVALLFRLARRGLGCSPRTAALAASLLALAPAACEAIAWCAAGGHVLLTTWLLLGASAALAPGRGRAAGLAVCQAAGLLCWDGAVALLPMAAAGLALGRARPAPREALRLLLPAALVWGAVVVARYALAGQDVAYGHVMDPASVARALGVAPLLVLAPCGTHAFYTGPAGVALGCALLLALGLAAWRDVRVRAALALGFACLLPWTLLVPLQPRYLYPALPFALLGVALALRRLPGRLALAAAVLLLAAHGGLASWQAREYADAWREAERVRAAVDAAGAEVVVNLPDAFGSAERLFRPLVWRNGVRAFARPFARVQTPGCGHAYPLHPGVPVVPRAEVAARWPGRRVVEVVWDGRRACFEVVAFSP